MVLIAQKSLEIRPPAIKASTGNISPPSGIFALPSEASELKERPGYLSPRIVSLVSKNHIAYNCIYNKIPISAGCCYPYGFF